MRAAFQAGEFNRLVTIEQLATTQDSLGAPAHTWTTFATWWCRSVPLTGQEVFGGAQIEARAQIRFDGNFINGVTAKMRINDHGKLYDISSPPLIADGRASRYMTILAKFGINNG